MNRILNITNGDSAVEIMKEAGIEGDFLPWRDVLHDGPVIQGFSLEVLSELRARFISNRGWGESEIIKQDFIDRNNQLKSYQDYEKVILWFEHDLYDQLQIIQILDWFSHSFSHGFAQGQQGTTKLTMICTESYLGMQSPDEMKDLMQYESPITKEQLSLASTAWAAFGSSDSNDWADLLNDDTSALPFLKGAILRQLEEYPDFKTGLSRTAYQSLKIFSQGETHCGRVFEAYSKTEERKFMGDSSFWVVLDEMIQASPPLLVPKNGSPPYKAVKQSDDLVITKEGEAVLSGKVSLLDYYSTTKKFNRWIGGTHLNKDYIFCWDKVNKVLLKYK